MHCIYICFLVAIGMLLFIYRALAIAIIVDIHLHLLASKLRWLWNHVQMCTVDAAATAAVWFGKIDNSLWICPLSSDLRWMKTSGLLHYLCCFTSCTWKEEFAGSSWLFSDIFFWRSFASCAPVHCWINGFFVFVSSYLFLCRKL